jgi:hypothetical protein
MSYPHRQTTISDRLCGAGAMRRNITKQQHVTDFVAPALCAELLLNIS